MKKTFFKKNILFLLILPALLLLFFSPKVSIAEMRSSSYIIYENLLHTFNGPEISAVSASVSDDVATISWDTDIPSNSFVIYDTDSAFSSSHEQGNAGESVTEHSVEVFGLDYSTTYYYRVKSKSPNGEESLSSTYSFSIGADPTPPQRSSGGGGTLIIDKTDKIAPLISDLTISEIGIDSALVSWQTDEESTSFVEYGTDDSFGNTSGEWSSSTEHNILLKDLKPGTQYYLRALSSDSWGNLAKSEQTAFETEVDESMMIDTDDDGEPDTPIPPDDLDSLLQKALEIMDDMAGTVSTEALREKLEDPSRSMQDLLDYLPAPIFRAEPRVEVEADKATVFWSTDVEASGLVALASEVQYNPQAENPYTRVIGSPDALSLDHEIELFGLEPDTTYHYQLRSQAEVGPMALSGDYTFTTTIETLEISNFFSQVEDDNTAVFKWITNKEANSSVEYTPYRGDRLSVEETKEMKNNELTVIHELTVEDFQPGIQYSVKIKSEDAEGNIATELIDPFSTSADDFPPQISQIKTNSSISSDREGRVQTVISWLTNEPATTLVYFMEGVHGPGVDLKNSSDKQNNDYSKDHVVLFTEFSPGTVYTFRVESVDSGGNKILSDPQTFMTPKKSESIIDVIIRVLEDTFGWVKDIMK